MTNLTTTTPTLEEALARFLRTLQGANKSAATITAYRTDLAQFIAFLHETNCTVSSPAGVTRSDVAEYLSALSDRGQSGITRARKLAAIREYFRFLEGNGLLERNPTVGIETPKKERPARTTLRPDEDTKQCSLTGAGIDLEQRTLTAEH